MTRDEFEELTLEFIASLSRTEDALDRTTPLFEGVIDSLRVLDLLAHIERTLSIRVSDEEIRLDNFRNVASIAEAFWTRSASQ